MTAIVFANNESLNASAIGRDLLAILYGEDYTAPVISRRTATVREQIKHLNVVCLGGPGGAYVASLAGKSKHRQP